MESLRSSWREEFAQNLIGERLPEFRALGQLLAARLKSALPADMTTSFDVADPDSPNYYTLTVSAKDADEINSVSFKADFDYLQRKVHVDKFNVIGLRGQGIGHQFFQEFMHECRAARYYTLNLQSSDIGSYFWIGQNSVLIAWLIFAQKLKAVWMNWRNGSAQTLLKPHEPFLPTFAQGRSRNCGI